MHVWTDGRRCDETGDSVGDDLWRCVANTHRYLIILCLVSQSRKGEHVR